MKIRYFLLIFFLSINSGIVYAQQAGLAKTVGLIIGYILIFAIIAGGMYAIYAYRRKKKNQEFMVEKRPVSVNRQTVFAVIPILAIWAAYKIQKGRIFLLIFWLGFGTVGITKDIAILGIENYWDSDLVEDLGDPVYLASFIALIAIEFGLRVYFVRKWSREWNERIQIGN